MHILVGLGNPGKQYIATRHNAGFLLLDYLSHIYTIPFRPGKGDYYFGETELNGVQLVLLKPLTYMNRSGRAILQAREQFGFMREELLVAYDDFHLPFGTLRFRPRGSDGGHNGIGSIIYELESDDFARLKIGIGRKFDNSVDFVLGPFENDEQEFLTDLFVPARKGIETWIESGIEQAMNQYNRNYIITNENQAGEETNV